MRAGRSTPHIGRKGNSNPRWLVGGKLCLRLNHLGLVVAWDCAGATAPDRAFDPRIEAFRQGGIVLGDTGCHATGGDPSTLKLGARGRWNTRLLVETVLALLTGVGHLQTVAHRTWAAFQARLALTLAPFNLLGQGDGLQPDAQGLIHLSLAVFRL